MFHGDALGIVDRAIDQCTREHGGKLTGDPSTAQAMGKRDDGSSFPFTLLTVEDDADGWWQEYARVHGWLDVSKGGIQRLWGHDFRDTP